MDAEQLKKDTVNAFRRLYVSDFQQEHATDEERRVLEAAPRPVKTPLAQDYAAWRRSLLWIAGVALTLLAIFEFITFEAVADALGPQDAQVLGQDNCETIDGLGIIFHLSVLLGGILAIAAALRWDQVRLSRRLARVGFLILFLTPFVIAALPVREMLDFSHLQPEAQAAVGQLMGLLMGMSLFMVIGPRAIALFPGVIRSSMTLKTLVPQSPMPGWAAVFVGPLYAIFIVVVFSLINQISGSFLLLAGLACFIISPLLYVRRGKDVLRPHKPEEVSEVVGKIRRKAAVFNVIGALLIAIFFIDRVQFGVDDLLKFFVSVLGNIVFLTVVGADFLMALMRHAHDQSRELVESKMDDDLEDRFDELAEAGFTDLKTGASRSEGEAGPPDAKDAGSDEDKK